MPLSNYNFWEAVISPKCFPAPSFILTQEKNIHWSERVENLQTRTMLGQPLEHTAKEHHQSAADDEV